MARDVYSSSPTGNFVDLPVPIDILGLESTHLVEAHPRYQLQAHHCRPGSVQVGQCRFHARQFGGSDLLKGALSFLAATDVPQRLRDCVRNQLIHSRPAEHFRMLVHR